MIREALAAEKNQSLPISLKQPKGGSILVPGELSFSSSSVSDIHITFILVTHDPQICATDNL